MKTLVRSLLGFIYSCLISVLFFVGFVWLLLRCLIYLNGFWGASAAICAIVVSISWIAERGLELLSIPFNWLWNEKFISRLSSCLPAIIVGLWAISTPWRIPFQFSAGDWVITTVWLFCVAVFYYNLATMSIISTHMGRVDFDNNPATM